MIVIAEDRRHANQARPTPPTFEQLLPQIEKQASLAFRGEPYERREDLIAEVIANAFIAYVRLVQRGKEDLAYATPLAQYAIKQVRSGRRVGSKLNVRDVSSEYAQKSKGFKVESLDQYNQRREQWKEVLVEDKSATPADVATCRIDFAAWLTTLSKTQRKAADLLATGESTTEVAKKVDLTPGRISQIRRELKRAWERFHGLVIGDDGQAVTDLAAVNRSLAVCGEALA